MCGILREYVKKKTTTQNLFIHFRRYYHAYIQYIQCSQLWITIFRCFWFDIVCAIFVNDFAKNACNMKSMAERKKRTQTEYFHYKFDCRCFSFAHSIDKLIPFLCVSPKWDFSLWMLSMLKWNSWENKTNSATKSVIRSVYVWMYRRILCDDPSLKWMRKFRLFNMLSSPNGILNEWKSFHLTFPILWSYHRATH